MLSDASISKTDIYEERIDETSFCQVDCFCCIVFVYLDAKEIIDRALVF